MVDQHLGVVQTTMTSWNWTFVQSCLENMTSCDVMMWRYSQVILWILIKFKPNVMTTQLFLHFTDDVFGLRLLQTIIFIFYFKFLLDQGPFVESLIAPIWDFVWPSLWVSKPGWFSHQHTYLLACCEPKGHVWCYTCLFHKYGCTLYKHVYSRPAFQTYLMQTAEGTQ